MNSKSEFIEACTRIQWLEREMRDSYAAYKNLVSDPALLNTLAEIEKDEIRHMNMSEKILTLLQQ